MQAIKRAHHNSLCERDLFWSKAADLVHWETPFKQILDFSNPPLIWVSTEVDQRAA